MVLVSNKWWCVLMGCCTSYDCYSKCAARPNLWWEIVQLKIEYIVLAASNYISIDWGATETARIFTQYLSYRFGFYMLFFSLFFYFTFTVSVYLYTHFVVLYCVIVCMCACYIISTLYIFSLFLSLVFRFRGIAAVDVACRQCCLLTISPFLRYISV